MRRGNFFPAALFEKCFYRFFEYLPECPKILLVRASKPGVPETFIQVQQMAVYAARSAFLIGFDKIINVLNGALILARKLEPARR
ncbi:hypothetical protein COR50_00840 [Chitinophaga caeni]|uniref:Uncharacterized protein n=1 Tax=Chitinophaga caeni TaxID=2029983 RepID=A0A291QP90_9BACT|nr:hypothetical protein COR50_00840 [Chitinophaga caeni]